MSVAREALAPRASRADRRISSFCRKTEPLAERNSSSRVTLSHGHLSDRRELPLVVTVVRLLIFRVGFAAGDAWTAISRWGKRDRQDRRDVS
jgi:hypothetical protein